MLQDIVKVIVLHIKKFTILFYDGCVDGLNAVGRSNKYLI